MTMVQKMIRCVVPKAPGDSTMPLSNGSRGLSNLERVDAELIEFPVAN